jgi:hypothetical protein
MRRAYGLFYVARFLCGFELIAREHQKLLGVAISVIGLLLVDFSFSKKPAGFVSKLDVFSRVLPDRFLQLAHFPSFPVLRESSIACLATSLFHSHSRKRSPIACIPLTGPWSIFSELNSWAELARFIAPMLVRVNEKSMGKSVVR